MLKLSTAEPANSMAQPVPPDAPICAMTLKAMSFALAPGRSSPSMRTSMGRILRVTTHCVASASSTSDVPTPKAKAANAPCVDVWESPHTTDIPGSVAPISGPTTCTTP